MAKCNQLTSLPFKGLTELWETICIGDLLTKILGKYIPHSVRGLCLSTTGAVSASPGHLSGHLSVKLSFQIDSLEETTYWVA